MAKVSGSYASVVLGVSEQVPQDRRSGQHFAQDNYISDPVRGLARRHGSLMLDEKRLAPFDPGIWEAVVEDTANHKELTFFVAGVEYALLYRSLAAVTPEVQDLSFAFACNKDTGEIVPVVCGTGTLVNQLKAGGVSAAVNVGKYVYLAGNTIVPSWVGTDRFEDALNQSRFAVWIRGGAFSRTFSATLSRADGTKVAVEYKTKPSAYPELLDTSDLLTSDPDYQKKVNDRVNAYNSAVTAYIGEAAEDITPENIAAKLRDAFATAGVTGLGLQGSTITIENANFVEVSADDGGDGSLVRAVGNRVSGPELVSTVHYVGKVVKVRPKKTNENDALYLEAIAKDEGGTGWTEVTWREAAGYVVQPVSVFAMGTVVGGTLYIGGSATELATLTPGPHPEFLPSTVGDEISSPRPVFFDRGINYLGLFQDRLVIGSGATLFYSRTGDYFNWFRQSVLTVDETDPVEIFALGAEDDTIRSSNTYDRNMLFFGDRKQYSVNGRAKFVPQTASIVVVSSYEDAVKAYPQESGNFVFYAKSRGNDDPSCSLHQIQTGMIADSPESFEVSAALDTYLEGSPVQLLTITAPNHVLMRTTGARNIIYTYTYLDTPSGTERLFDAWSRWVWDPSLGACVGLTRHDGDILCLTVRESPEGIFLSLDRFVLDSRLSRRPYLDSLRPMSAVRAPTVDSFLTESFMYPDRAAAAFDDTSDNFLLGTYFNRLEGFEDQYPLAVQGSLWAGVEYGASVVPTNPYVRDKNDKAIVQGRLTLGRVGVSFANSGGLSVDVTSANGTIRTQDFNGRLLGQQANQVGRQPIVTATVTAAIGKEVRECTYKISAKRWLPLTITAIEWTGQFFNNSRRV